MLILKGGEVCPYLNKCKYTDGCWGIKSSRKNEFTCELVDSNGNFVEAKNVKNFSKIKKNIGQLRQKS